nr:hypothetical protein [Tanacetum cinerariifolium]
MMLAPSGEGLILYQAYGNLYAIIGRKAYLLEEKQTPSVRVFDKANPKSIRQDGVARLATPSPESRHCRQNHETVARVTTPSLEIHDTVSRF